MILLIDNSSDDDSCNVSDRSIDDDNNDRILMVIIHHSMLDLLGIEFHHFSMYGISGLIFWVTSLKSVIGNSF
jgi:hypothetical protein